MTCHARQHSDQMLCRCGLAWDVNDPDPPECRADWESNLDHFRGRVPDSRRVTSRVPVECKRPHMTYCAVPNDQPRQMRRYLLDWLDWADHPDGIAGRVIAFLVCALDRGVRVCRIKMSVAEFRGLPAAFVQRGIFIQPKSLAWHGPISIQLVGNPRWQKETT